MLPRALGQGEELGSVSCPSLRLGSHPPSPSHPEGPRGLREAGSHGAAAAARSERSGAGGWWGGGRLGQGSQRVGPTVLVPAEALLRFCVTWNTNSRHCHDAQAVLGVLLRHEPPEELLAYPGVQASLEALLPYTGTWARPGAGWEQPASSHGAADALCPPPERHFQRLSRTLQAATFLDFLWHNMKLPTLPAAPSVAPSAL